MGLVPPEITRGISRPGRRRFLNLVFMRDHTERVPRLIMPDLPNAFSLQIQKGSQANDAQRIQSE